MDRFPKTNSYLCYKWLLFSICLVLISMDIVMISFSKQIAKNYDDDSSKVMQNTIIGESIISMVFTTFGLVGSYRENYCCVAIFAVYMTLSIIAEIYLSLLASGFWFTTIIFLFITIISYSFARQIRNRLIVIALQPQTAYMRNYGQTFGLQYNSPQYSANNNVLQFQTLEVNGRYLPPYYNTRRNSIHFEPTLPTVAELPANPPPYEENDTNPKKVAQSSGHNNV